MVPLLLQFGAEQADVWTLLLSALLTETLALLSNSSLKNETMRSCSDVRVSVR